MNVLSISPVQWSKLKNIDDVEPIGDGDAACLAEVRDVLKKHGALLRFGVALLHSHFDLADDEIMLESSDDESRSLLTRPVRQADAGDRSVGTIWMLREGNAETMSWCRRFCRKLPISGGHNQDHNRVPGK